MTARLVQAALALKHNMKLELDEDPKLGICEACGCDLRLKVWVPGEVVMKDGRPDYFEKLHPLCWIRML